MQDRQRNDKTTPWLEHLVAYVVKVGEQITQRQIDPDIVPGGDELALRMAYHCGLPTLLQSPRLVQR